MKQANNLHLQYGCGLSAPEGWVNFDASPWVALRRIPLVGWLARRRGPAFAKNVRYGDVVRGLPVADGSCRAIYCSHVLEHLAMADAQEALANTLGYLQPGGVFRLVVPDLQRLARDYLAAGDGDPAGTFMERAALGMRSRPRGLSGVLRAWLGHSRHLWMWDFASLSAELRRAGFEGVRRATYGDSALARFGEVEDPDRWDGCLGLECRRP